MKKRILSCLMALALCLTLLPAAALAEETEGTAQTPPAVEEPADPANGGAKQENQPAEQGEQQEDPAAKQAVAAVQAMIDALPDAEALDGMDDEDAMAVYEAFQTACEAYYETLTEEQQAQLKNTEKLAALSDWFNAQVAPLENSGDIFPDTVDADGSIIRHTSWRRNGPIYEGGDGDADFTDGQSYVVQGSDVTIHGNLTVGGIGTLILCQGAKLTVEGALICSGSYSIYGQSDKGNNAGRLVIENSKGGGAAIRSSENGAPTLSIYSGEVTINGGNSKTLIDGVKLSSTSHIHQGTLDGTALSPEVWGADSLKGGTLTLAYCQHEHDADQKLIPDDSGTTHHRHCEACGFDWASEACDFDNPDHYVPNPKDRANTHLPVCECGNESETSTPHDLTCVQTDDGKGHTQRCIYCFYTPTENNPVEEHHYKANGECENCGFKPVARDEAGNLYEKVTAALKAAEDGSWVILETQAKDKAIDEHIEFNDPGKTVELKMNGYTLTSSGNPTLTVENGTLKITGDAVINQTGGKEMAAPAVRVTGGTLIFDGKLNATGASGKPAVLVTGGTLRLKAGDVLNGGVSVAGSTAYANVNALLGDGLAFAKEDEHSIIIVNGNVKSIDENVVVKEHKHGFTPGVDGKYTCACGYTCPHNDFKDGKCTICGNGCAHTNVDENGLCRNCKTQMAVESETGGTVTYGTDFKAAMKAAEDGTTVTLLADIEWGVTPQDRAAITGDGKIVTLNLNGHTITGGWFDIGSNNNPTSCTLKIIGEGSHKSLRGSGGYSGVSPKATLDLSEWKGGTISSINISDDSRYEAETREAAVIVGLKAGTIGKLTFGNNQLGELKKTKLSGGSFNEIWVADFGPVKLGELLAEGYAFQNGDGSYVEYGRTLQGTSIYNVKVVKCLHPNMKPDAATGVATCEYCGKSGNFVASVDGNLYTDMDDAITYWLTNGGTLKLYDDYTAATEKATWTIVSGEHSIDLNGHMMSVQGDGNAFKPTNNMHLTVTDGTELGQITNILLDGSQRGSFTLENGFVGNLVMTGGAVVTLKGGHVDKLDVQNCSANTNLSIQGGSLGKLNITDWAEGMHVSATGGSLGAYTLPSGKILADVLDHQYYATGTSLDKQVDTAQPVEEFVIRQAPHDFGSTSKAAAVPINGSIPFRVDSPSENVGVYDVKWYRRTDSGAEHMTQNRVDGVKVGDKLDVLCVITGADRPGGAMKWQVAVKDYTIKVVPADLSQEAVVFKQVADGWGAMGNIGDGKGTFVFTPYGGSTASPTELSYLFEVSCNERKLTEGSDYTITGGNTAKWAGTYTLTIEGKGNYTGTATHQWEIKPYTLSKGLDVARIDRDYDGTTNLSAEELIGLGRFVENLENRNSKNPSLGSDQSGCTIRLGAEDFEVSNVKLGSAEAGDTTASFTIKLKPRPGQTAANFVFEDGTSEMTVKEVSVSTREAFLSSSPEAGELNVANDHAGVYTLDLSKLLPKLESPKEYGKVTYALDTVSINGGYYDAAKGSAEVKDGKLILPIQAVETSTESNIGTVTVKVTSGNIVDFDLTINVNATNKIVPTGTPTLSKNTLAWGEQLSTITLSGAMKDGDTEVKGTFAWTNSATTPSDMNDFEAEWKFTPENTDVYAEITDTVTIKVIKATPTGAPKYTAINASGKTLADAALAVNEAWPEGTVQWVDENGVELDVSAEVKDNTAYRWRFVPTDAEHYNEASGAITLYTVSHSGGGGSSSGSSDNNPIIKTETKNHADGSTTKTETKKDGTVIETTTGKDGSVSKTETKPDGSSVTESKAADGSTGTVKTDKNGQTEAKTALSNKAIEDAKKNGEAVKAPVEVKASRDSSTAPTVSIELPKGAGETKVEIPVINVKPGTVAILVHADGTEEIVKNSLLTEDGIQLTVNGGATVKIVDNSKDFIDTRAHWAKDAIDFVSARGLVNGMNDSIYAPNASTTRAQLWTILARQNDANLNGGNTWYENAQNWAKAKGISDGANPNADINRAQMVTMLWRAEGQPAAGGAATFTDVSADSYYAQAVAWAIENGITTGVGGGKFDPNTTCTRAQIAAFLYRYMK